MSTNTRWIRCHFTPTPWLALLASLAWACREHEVEGATTAAAPQAAATEEVRADEVDGFEPGVDEAGAEVHVLEPGAEEVAAPGTVGAAQEGMHRELTLAAYELQADGLWAEAVYELDREGGELVPDFELELGNAPPQLECAVVLDGFALGKLHTNKKGGLKLEFAEEDDRPFPPGFAAPKVGSLLRIGELVTLRFAEREAMTDLEAEIAVTGPLSGDVDFDVQRIGSTTTREFLLKLEGAPAGTRQPVFLDDVHVGDVAVDSDGEGRLEFSTKRPEPFPASFPELRAGSRVRVGELFSGELHDELADTPAR